MNKPYIIGVTGGSGSGKTKFIKNLVNHFSNEQVCLISQDNYYQPRNTQPVDENGVLNFDVPESMDLEKMVIDIKNLLQGKTVILQEYTYNNPHLPGNIQAMEHIMLSRRIIRDEQERGYDLDDVLYRYQHHVMPSFRKYILPYKAFCDIIVNNNEGIDGAIGIMVAYIENLLQKSSS